MLMILAPPAGDAFNFVVNLAIYPAQAFLLALAVGLYTVRYQRKKAGIVGSDFRAWDIAIIFTILVNIYCLVMPWYPPPGGADAGEFSFWYAAYVVASIGMQVFPHPTGQSPLTINPVLSSALCIMLCGCTSSHTLEGTLSDKKRST